MHVAKNEIIYKDAEFGGMTVIQAGAELTAKEEKALGKETLESLLKSGAIVRKKDAKDTVVAATPAKAGKANDDGFNK